MTAARRESFQLGLALQGKQRLIDEMLSTFARFARDQAALPTKTPNVKNMDEAVDKLRTEMGLDKDLTVAEGSDPEFDLSRYQWNKP